MRRFNASYNQSIDISATRRNIVTKGIDLNALVGKEFTIGKAKFRGVELCEPCRKLGRLLGNNTISRGAVVKAFVGSGGLRADVITSGIISSGMPITIT